MGILLTTTGLPFLASAGSLATPVGPVPIPVPKPDPEEIALRGPTSTISYRGVTFTFSNPVYWIESANGDPVVISHSDYLPTGTTITSISPAAGVSAGGKKYNGTVRNPIETTPMSVGQGFDEGLAHTPWSAPKQHAYVDLLNIDPGNTGTPITIETGETFTIVKAVRAADAADTDRKPIEKYVPLTIMDSLPPRPGTWFRPAISSMVKEWPRIPVEEMDFSGGESSPLRNLPNPEGLDNPSVYLDRIEQWDTKTIPLWGSTSEEGRRSYLHKEINPDTYYARDSGRERGKYALSLFIDQTGNPTEQIAREKLAAILIQWGIDRDGAHQMGNYGGAGAGQHYGYHPAYYLAAFMLGDADILERAQWHRSNTFQQCFWVGESSVGYPVTWDTGSTASGSKKVGETYRSEHVGLPDWTTGGWMTSDRISSKTLPSEYIGTNASLVSAYRDTHFDTVILEAFPISLLRNGPGGETGIDAINHGQPVGTDNIASATLPYIDRSITFLPAADLFRHVGTAREVYNAWRDEIAQPRWQGQPDIISDHDFPVFTVENTEDAEIVFDASIIYYTTKEISDRQVSYSQDGLQFVDPISISANTAHRLTGLRPGTPHWCRWRQINADNEPSSWSQTWVQNLPSGSAAAKYKEDRGKVTPMGTPSGALTCAINPALVYKPYPDHPMPYFEPLTDATGVRFFHAGMGYWAGGTGGLTPSYQWQRDDGTGWEDIAGATEQMYARQLADSGCDVRCLVTVMDAADASEAVATNAISVPAPSSIPAGTVIDTDFDGEFPFDYPDVWQQMSYGPEDPRPEGSRNRSVMPKLYSGMRIHPDYSAGMLRIARYGRYPKMLADLATDAEAGEYEYEVHLGGGFFPTHDVDNMNVDMVITIRDGNDNILADLTLPKEQVTREGYMTVKSGTFTAPAGTIRFRYFVDSSTGSDWAGYGGSPEGAGVLGGPVFTKMRIQRLL